MKIFQIQPFNKSFQAKRKNHITKSKQKKNIKDAIASSATAITTLLGINEILTKNGITYCKVDDNTIHTAAGYNGGFFSLKFDTKYKTDMLKAYFAQSIDNKNNLPIGGFLNYKSMVNELKRQDIIQKGLQIHTYELNTTIPKENADLIATWLSKLAKKYIKYNDLFFIEDDAFYYDNLDKTAYCINSNSQTFEKAEHTYRICKFITDENGNAIGYSINAENLYHQCRKDKSYKEQQEPSCEIPAIVDTDNNKLLAEAFHFGTTKKFNVKMKKSAAEILNHLENRVGIKNPKMEQLQIVNFYNKNKDVVNRICYYDSTTGRSLIYNDEGKYLYQMEYLKDDSGNIISYSKY